ncbi:uncharacterized protein LOC129243100 [Anastrepha obliqua]|uniref:uncharacterized protein LOC129243100 n=1 Tax=Anastrepha obliqua TaxID=95512 RepID=UPI002409833F|nr:uncharacterized protein LOC129243100 [Anastrepha obliqua]
MTKEKSDIDTLELPEYCFHNKFILVEELALERNFLRLHQGRCTVIGRLQQHHNGYLILENINLSHLPRKYALPEGTANLRIFKFAVWDVELKIGHYCEVVGEVVLWNPNNSRDNWLRVTPRGALESSQNFDKINNKEIFEQLHKKYFPAINCFKIDYIECPAELIERHLKIRHLALNNAKK